ncbi:MAG: 1-acyl-sn-glycerol-3-phosphate acyltransferase [Bacteroidales bacterium]|jgi:1-acyl-sn-glycerol-3-phosphate acyltransferase|nr:1-acyl-sn-glycerol-3-phosphate acyltransferase [Bacteroidales bacterium]
MVKILIEIYDFFKKHGIAFFICLLLSSAFFVFFASKVKFEQNTFNFFPKAKGMPNASDIFEHLKVSDRLVVMFSEKDSSEHNGENLVAASEKLKGLLSAADSSGLIEKYVSSVGNYDISLTGDFVYEHLPLFMDDSDYKALDSLLSPSAMHSKLAADYSALVSPAGLAAGKYIFRDPLGIGMRVLSHLSDMNIGSDYRYSDGHVYTSDGRTLLSFIIPEYSSGNIGKNDGLVTCIENSIDSLRSYYPSLDIDYFGAPAVSVYNARQIKKDTFSTSFIALIIIILFITLVFKRKRSVFLILFPVAYGAAFALAVIYFIKGSISGIAVGSGSAIMGVALSYSIHMLSHQNHVYSVSQLLREIAGPLAIGSLTTVGAFMGLLFTTSELLRDFGLFAALTLIGTTLFCLLFLPHFLSGQENVREGRFLSHIEAFNSYPFEKNKWLVGFLTLLVIVCLPFSGKVGFDSDMMDLNYWEPHLLAAEQKLGGGSDSGSRNVMFISIGKDQYEASTSYSKTDSLLSELKKEGRIEDYADAGRFLPDMGKQEEALKKWNNFWTPGKKSELVDNIAVAAAGHGFSPDAFDAFIAGVDKNYKTLDFFSDSVAVPELFGSWFSKSDKADMFISQVRLPNPGRESVYERFSGMKNVIICDQSYFADKAASSINDDFYLVLFISSFLIFFVLWLTYGRLELAVLSFLPMLISWVIITGLMAMFGIRFNIVNIILSTFIFGMGDDFSIFILDGLLNKYKRGKALINSHKTAIFFSTFTIVVGVGSLIFARHPALHSIALIIIMGMSAVVLVAYTAEPVIFNFMISKPATKGRPPFTFVSLLRSAVFYLIFFAGCLLLALFVCLMIPLPVSRKRKRSAAAFVSHLWCAMMMKCAWFVKIMKTGNAFACGENNRGRKDSHIIIANHQSIVDILMILAEFPKVKFVVADWVLASPLLSGIARYLGYYSKSDGYDKIIGEMKRDMDEGWSIVIFPEGTRSCDGEMKRFHKGAFYIAEVLEKDILPILFYGNWRIIPKNSGMNIASGLCVMKLLPEIKYSEDSSYREKTKSAELLMKNEYSCMCRIYDGPGNPYFRWALISNYIYKGPVTEWYVRIKTRLERDYSFFDRILPRNGSITDIGCGMGQLDYMLSMYSSGRRIIGVDYDSDKISIASNCWMKKNLPDLSFVCSDILDYKLPESDAFVISDMLHYLDPGNQVRVIRNCAGQLRPGGIILMRDGDADNVKGQKMTDFTEFLSVKVFRFNKIAGALNFLSGADVRKIAGECGLSFKCVSNDKMTSNMFYILGKK